MAIGMADIRAQYEAIGPEIRGRLDEVFSSCQFILGPNVEALEKEVAEISGAKYGVSVASGTDAILISLLAAGVGPGDEVITTPFTFVATAEAVALTGAKPVFVDIRPDTFNMDPALIPAAITERTKAILPVHLYGQCADVSEILGIAGKHNLRVVWDGAQAIGAGYEGKGIGGFRDAVTLSFFPTKNLGACGDGGMILTNDDQIAAAAKSLRFHGTDDGYNYKAFAKAVAIGYCSRLDEIQAAILRIKLKYLQDWTKARRANAAYYTLALESTGLTVPVELPGRFHVYHQYTLRCRKRDALQAELKQHGVGSAVYYPLPLHANPAYSHLGYNKGDLPESEKAAREVLSIPVYPELTVEHRETVADAVRKAAAVVGES